MVRPRQGLVAQGAAAAAGSAGSAGDAMLALAPPRRPALMLSAVCPPAPSPPRLPDILDDCKVGDSVKVEVLRGGTQRKTLTVVLAERQPEVTE